MKMISWLLSLGAAGLVFGVTSSAFATAPQCTNDIDCPNAACGGEVCQWVTIEQHECQAAGSKPKGEDGWCTTDADCKCNGAGAKCVGVFCTFTTAADAPASGGTSGTGTGGTNSSTTEASADEGGCSMSRAPSNGLAAFGVAIGVGALAFGLRRRRD
jgi:hypothetical protein